MIAESHAHLSHFKFDGRVCCVVWEQERYQTKELAREELLLQMREQGVGVVIEPAIDLSSNEKVLALHHQHPSLVFCAVGVHPTRTYNEKWRERKRLEDYLKEEGVVAVGETGLDFHLKGNRHCICQTAWFLYQLSLAKRHRLPLVLHTRRADGWVQLFLRLFGRGLKGGVVHCFTGDARCARRYLDMGYHIGIGGTLLQEGEAGQRLREALKDIPLERMLVETDAPYVFPTNNKKIAEKSVRKLRNSPLILKRVIEQIALIKGLTPRQVEEATYLNTLRLFSIPTDGN